MSVSTYRNETCLAVAAPFQHPAVDEGVEAGGQHVAGDPDVAFPSITESLLIDAGGWRWAFFVNLFAAVAARRIVPESVIGGPIPDLVGVALLSGAITSPRPGHHPGRRVGLRRGNPG